MNKKQYGSITPALAEMGLGIVKYGSSIPDEIAFALMDRFAAAASSVWVSKPSISISHMPMTVKLRRKKPWKPIIN